MGEFFLRPRRTALLVVVASVVATLYVAVTFDVDFLAGRGPFWAYPVGPWLEDPFDTKDNLDVLDYLVAYTGLLRSPWTFPPFHVAAIGAPTGTSVVFLDVIPIVALTGRVISELLGTFILPYGLWTGLCFVLSAVFATLLLAEGGQRSLLAAVSASVFAISAPTLLHRFAHFPLMAHFLMIGALYLYLREQTPLSRAIRLLCWLAWLLVALLTSAYLFAMVSAIYAATLMRSWRSKGIGARLLEPALISCVVVLMLLTLGFIGSGAPLSAEGYGTYSMNLLSPFRPQRSGLFPSLNAIADATGGQYEGFNYFGFGGLVLLVLAYLLDSAGLRQKIAAHREMFSMFLLLSMFSVSTRVWLGGHELVDVDLAGRFADLAGIFRSSGRMFWPVYYGFLLGSLLFVLSRLPRKWRTPVVGACCLLQLIDAEPLRARLTSLTNHGGTPLLDRAEWSKRLTGADFVEIYPTFFCSDDRTKRADMELQLVAIREGKSFNVSYNPRLDPDCEAEAAQAMAGPWSPKTLYVYLNGPMQMPRGWAPAQLTCSSFPEGLWCLGRKSGSNTSSSPH